ncbi:MAG: glycosyltransferase [Candidatus Peribacteraceae bacterium]|jgi:glycosyltransferase involved in cell wall biosynthesis
MEPPNTAQLDVLIPTYNPQPDHLREALTALKAQTFADWRCLIHDDASDVDVRKMVEPYLDDPRFTFERSERRLGIGRNWNTCFKKTSSPIVAYLFQDDVWDPMYLQRAVQILSKHPDVGFVSMNHTYNIETSLLGAEEYSILQQRKRDRLPAGRNEGRIFLNQWIEDSLWPNLIGEPDFVVIRRNVMDLAGPFNEEMNQVLDQEYWVRLLLHTNLYYCDETSGFFRVHANAATARNRQEGRGLFERFKILDDHIKDLSTRTERKAAQKAQIKQFQLMAEKYRTKRDRGDTISYKGAGTIKKFCLRHPIVAAKTLLRTRFRG